MARSKMTMRSGRSTLSSSLEPEYDEAKVAAFRIADAWWSFLDERESLAA